MTRRLKIVVADDDRDTREYLQEFLTYLGHDVRAAGDGRRLVELCGEFVPDLLVTDYAMPGLDGLAAAAEVNRDRPVPVVLLSARHDLEPEGKAGGGPVVRVLLKPVKEADLRGVIESVAARADRPRVPGGT